MKIRKLFEILIILILMTFLGIAIFFYPSSFAATITNTTTIALNVSAVAIMVITPTYVEWLNVPPGNNGTAQSITITNKGSVNLTNIYASVNSFALETTNPLFTGNPADYAAGSFLVLHNSTESEYRFVNRMEWNYTDTLDNYVPTPGAVSRGFFKNITKEYLWDIVDDSNGQCLNTSEVIFKIKTVPDDGTNRDMSVNTVTGTGQANTTEWSTWTFSSGPLAGYCVAIYKDCTKIMIYQFDHNSSLPSCPNLKYIQSGALTPSSSHVMSANVYVPKGIPAGNTTQSTLTITASYTA